MRQVTVLGSCGTFPEPDRYQVGPFGLTGLPLPHFVPNAGIRLHADGTVLA